MSVEDTKKLIKKLEETSKKLTVHFSEIDATIKKVAAPLQSQMKELQKSLPDIKINLNIPKIDFNRFEQDLAKIIDAIRQVYISKHKHDKCIVCGNVQSPNAEHSENLVSSLSFEDDEIGTLSLGDFILYFNHIGVKIKEDGSMICSGCSLDYWDQCLKFKRGGESPDLK